MVLGVKIINNELDGGVHQICIKNISKNTNNFSKIQDNLIGLKIEIMIIIVYVLVLGLYIIKNQKMKKKNEKKKKKIEY